MPEPDRAGPLLCICNRINNIKYNYISDKLLDWAERAPGLSPNSATEELS